MKNIIVYGSSNMAGHMICDILSNYSYNIKKVKDSDIFSSDMIKPNFHSLRTPYPDYIINCV